MIRVASVFAVLIALVGAGSAHAATLQQVGLFNKPIYVTSAPDPDRLFVVEREGRIEQVQNGTISNFADLGPGGAGKVSCCSGERGLQSIAIAPDFATSGRFYVDYTGFEGEIHVAEMRAEGATAPLSTLRDLLVIPHPEKSNHYGGQLQFGPDGMLYISTGDGGGEDDELSNSQNPKKPLGKILRIDPRPSGLLPYTIPPGNPYAGGDADDDAVWSLGLRNPYRFSFDGPTNAIVIGDVGQTQREEVDYAAAGAAGLNYGWACREGLLAGPRIGEPECATPPAGGYTTPIFEYGHDDPGPGSSRCAIVGGYVVRDASLGDLYGRYLYGDYCGGSVRSFALSDPTGSDRPEGLEVPQMTSFGEDSCGRIYTASEAGRVSRLLGSSAVNCSAAAPRKISRVGIKAQGRRVKKRKRAQITAWVSPCGGRVGEPVKLWRGRVHLGTRRLDRACSVRFRPQITRRAVFRATVAEDANYVAATSRKLRIKIDHRKPSRRQR
ncbi:MAG TPA: PQQ-dependent sugar dehydrogenase [Solirubrobacterales bacterium]|nr:PQQ-dependent sugar dehydrogenase [Solirubrobacterales bacterium]